MTRQEDLEKRQVTALERIADELTRLNDREEAIIAMTAKRTPEGAQFITTPAPVVPKQQERTAPTQGDAEFPDDEVEGLGPDDE
jgi:hypothetical protein